MLQGAIGRAGSFRRLARPQGMSRFVPGLAEPQSGTAGCARRDGRRFLGLAAGMQASSPSWRAMPVLGAAAGGCGWFWVASASVQVRLSQRS